MKQNSSPFMTNSRNWCFLPVLLIVMAGTLKSAAATANSENNPLSLDQLMPSLYQEVYPLKESGIREPSSLGQLPDGRIVVVANNGEWFVFSGKNWEKIPQNLPNGSEKIFSDSNGTIWIGGRGKFGKLDDAFNYEEFSELHFPELKDSTLPVHWFYETGDWLHWANNLTICHYNRLTGETKTTQFEGMFDAYHWLQDGKLYLGTEKKIEVWNDNHFDLVREWNHDYRVFQSWTNEGKDYYLTALRVHIYEGDKLVKSIKDPLMKMRGAEHVMTPTGVYLLVQSGFLKINLDASCEGYFRAWYHQPVTRFNGYSPQYFGNDEVWFLSDTAIFRVHFDVGFKTVGVETGYAISGAWDIEIHDQKLYTTSIKGMEVWNPETKALELCGGDAPDFETYGMWKAFDQLYISTWVELGGFDENYHIAHSDGAYEVFAKADQEDAFWVSKDTGINLIRKDFEVLDTIDGIGEDISSIIEADNVLWVATSLGKLVRIERSNNNRITDFTDSVATVDQTEKQRCMVLEISDRIFVLTPKNIWEWKENQFVKACECGGNGWVWEIPQMTNQEETAVLIQRNEISGGCKIGLAEFEPNTGKVHWRPKLIPLQIEPDTIRRIKALDGVSENAVAVITSSNIQIVDLDRFPVDATTPPAPLLVASALELPLASYSGIINGKYQYHPDSPITLQLYSPAHADCHPIYFYGRLRDHSLQWQTSESGKFEYYGIMKGGADFEGYAIDAFGNKSEIIHHKINVIPPWYLTNSAILLYLILLGLLVYFIVKLQTNRLKQRSRYLEKVVEERTLDLQRANDAKSIFVSNVSHEIRNPMNGLLGLAQSLKVGDIIDYSTLQRLRRPSFYLYRFLSNVLDFSKFESGGIRFTDRVFDPQELLESISSMFSGDLQERRITLSADYRYDGKSFIVASQEALEMILINLVGNAVKYTPLGGHIRIAILKSKGSLSASVADSGVGIKEDDQKRIFEAYEQGEQIPLIAGEKGAGIGLSLVSNTIQQLGGEIGVQSIEGKGATFSFRIPIQEPDEAGHIGIIDKVHLKGRFLVVEDLEYNLKLFTDLLIDWGAVVDGATTGEQALNLLQKHDYQMVFADYDLPDMNGADITRELRNSDRNQETLVVGLSAYTDQEYIQKGLGAGMNDYLFKPLNSPKLVECIQKHLATSISFTTRETSVATSSRSSLAKLLRTAARQSDQGFASGIQEYLETLDSLISKLNVCDFGSDEFETILHQLKGHSSFINHESSICFWEKLSELSKTNQRMKLLDQLEALPAHVIAIKLEIEGLIKLEKDFEQLQTARG